MDKNVNTLYEMLVAAEKENNTKNISALRYAIFTIENAEQNNNQLPSDDAYKLLLFEIDTMSYKSVDEKLTFSEWKQMNDKLQKAYDNNMITKRQCVHLIALITNYHCIEE